MHSWELTPAQAILLQKKLAGQVIQRDQLGKVTRIAGVDVCVHTETAQAAVVVLGYPKPCVLETAVCLHRASHQSVEKHSTCTG